MALLFSSSMDDPDPWREVLAKEFPNLDFRVWPHVSPREDIKYALIFDIETGVLQSLPNLKAILALGAGVDQILKDKDFPKNVPLFRLVDAGLREQMSEYGIYSVLYFHRHMGEYADQQRRHRWKMLKAVLPSERTVGVMGLGVLGGDLARKLSILGFRTIGWSRTQKAIKGVECLAGEEVLTEFLGQSEILVNLLPLTKETRGILCRNTFDKLPDNAVVINVGRGGHLIESDLIEALNSGKLSGAMLDVFETEPLPDENPLWDHPKVVVTPHVAVQPVAQKTYQQIIEKIRFLEEGKEPIGRVNVDMGY